MSLTSKIFYFSIILFHSFSLAQEFSWAPPEETAKPIPLVAGEKENRNEYAQTQQNIEPENLQTPPAVVAPNKSQIEKLDKFDIAKEPSIEKKEQKEDVSLWKGAMIVFAFIGLIGLFSIFTIRARRHGLFKNSKTQAPMQIVSSISLNPKRQILLFQVRGKEFVIANTESGINLLTEITDHSENNQKLLLQKKISDEEKTQINDHKKSEVLKKALSMIEKKEDPRNTPEAGVDDINIKSENFPKYFSSIFDAEYKKDPKKKEDNDNVESVTNLIREKLRSMKPIR